MKSSFIMLVVSIFVTAGYMYNENLALSVYGDRKSHGTYCKAVDIKLNVYKYYVSKHNRDYGIHGCRFFIKIR